MRLTPFGTWVILVTWTMPLRTTRRPLSTRISTMDVGPAASHPRVGGSGSPRRLAIRVISHLLLFLGESDMNWLQNLTSTLPYMVSPGNHESECHSPVCLLELKKYGLHLNNFSAFNARWHMPSAESGARSGQNMWYRCVSAHGGRPPRWPECRLLGSVDGVAVPVSLHGFKPGSVLWLNHVHVALDGRDGIAVLTSVMPPWPVVDGLRLQL